jgi:hypothetical protein
MPLHHVKTPLQSSRRRIFYLNKFDEAVSFAPMPRPETQVYLWDHETTSFLKSVTRHPDPTFFRTTKREETEQEAPDTDIALFFKSLEFHPLWDISNRILRTDRFRDVKIITPMVISGILCPIIFGLFLYKCTAAAIILTAVYGIVLGWALFGLSFFIAWKTSKEINSRAKFIHGKVAEWNHTVFYQRKMMLILGDLAAWVEIDVDTDGKSSEKFAQAKQGIFCTK